MIAVHNSGSAIPEREHQQIFERFYRGSRRGTCPRYRHGARDCPTDCAGARRRCTVSSTPADGTTFTLSLPKAGPDVMSAGRVLVVDDDPQIGAPCASRSPVQGYEIDDAKGGRGGARISFVTSRFDLVLLDMNMAGMNGLDMLSL